MSFDAGDAGGACGLDLNCDTVAFLDSHEAGMEDGSEDAPVSTSGEFLDKERGETMDVEGDENKECESGIPDQEDGMMGNAEESVASELGGRSEVDAVGIVIVEAGAESHGGKVLDVEFEDKGSAELVSVSTVDFEEVVGSGQDTKLGSGGDQKRGADVDKKGVMGTDEISVSVLVGDGGKEDERLEGSSILRREQAEVQVDEGVELLDGQLDLEETEPDTVEKEIIDLVIVSAENFEAVNASNQAVTLENVSGGDQKQGINVDAEGMVIDQQIDPGEKDAEVVSHSGKFLEEKEEDGSAELAVVSTEGFEPFEESIHAVDFHDGPAGDQKRGTGLDSELDLGEKGSAELVAVSNVGFEADEASGHAMYLGDGFEDDRNRFTDADKEEMVRTDEDFLATLVCGREAEDESLEVSSNMREEQVEVDLVDEGVQVLVDQSGPEEKEAEGDSLCIKPLEMDAVGAESADLIAVSAKEFKAVEASYQAAMEIGTGGSESANLVAVSAEELEAVEATNQAVNLGDGSSGDQKQGIDLDDEGMVIDGQLGPGEKDSEVLGSAVLASVSNEEYRSVEASSHPMDLHDESGGDQKQVTDLDEEGMIIDGELGSGKSQAELETMEGKLLEMDRGEKEGTVLAAVSTECFEHAKVCSQAIVLSDGSGDDHRLRTGLNAENTVGINEDSVALLVGSGRKLLEADCRDKRSAEMVAVSPEVHEPVKASDQAINLLNRSGDDQSLLIDVVAEGMVGINEDSVAISVANVAPEDERSEVSLVLRDEQVEVRGDLDDGRGQDVEDELDTGKGEGEFKSYSGMEVDMGKKGITMLVGASAELSEAVEASSESMILADGSGGDQKRGGDVDTEGLMGTDEFSVAVLVGGGGDNEKMEGSSILRSEHHEIQLDLVDESDHAVGAQLGCVKSKAEVNSHEEMLLELHSEEKESADLVAASAEEFDAIEVSDQAMNLGVGSCGVQMQRVDADAKGMDIDVQLSPGERDAEVESHSRKILELDKREEGSAEPVAVSSEVFELVETSSQVMDFGDGSDGDHKRGTDVNVEGVPMDTELSTGKTVAKVEFHGEKFLEVDRDNERSTELPAVSTDGWFLPGEAGSEPMNFVDGCGDDQRLETDVDAELIVRTDEDSVAISIASGASKDARLEGSLISRKDHVEVQDNLVDAISEVVEGELGTAVSVAEVKLYGEKHMEVDIGENGSTKLVASSTELSDAVLASNQALELEDGSGSDQIQETDADAEGMVRNEDSVTDLVVGGAPGNESLEGSLTSGTEQVEILAHFADRCGQVENELESHGGKLLVEKREELIAASAERFEAVEASCQAMDLGDRSGGDQMQGIDVNVEGMVDISADCDVVSAGGEGPEAEMLEEESSVLGTEDVEALRKSVDGCGQVVDSELIHRERIPIVESHGGELLKVETGVKGGAEAFVISSEGFEAVEACSRATDLEHGSGGDQKQGTDVDAENAVGIDGDSANVSGADGGPEDESSEKSLLLGKEHNEVQVLDGEFGLVKRDAEAEPYSEKLSELDVRETGSAELASVPAGVSATVEATSQDVDFEDGYSSEQKQESNVGAACMVKTDEDSVVVSVDGGGPEDEMLNISSNLVKEVEVGEETHGIGSTVKDLPESTKNESVGYDDTLIHADQIQTEFDGRQDADAGAEAVVGGTEEAYKFGGKQVDVGEDNIGHEMLEKKSANPEEIGGGEVDPVHSKHVEDLESRDEFGGDHRTESCMETDADTLVAAVDSEGASRSDGEKVNGKCGSDKSQMVEKVAHFQRSGDTVNVDVCDLVEVHPDERGGEIISDNGHNPSEVNSAFSAGDENMIEKGLACLPESVDQKALVTNEKEGISLESFQVSELELMEVETGIVDHSTVSPERAEVLTQASSIENDLKISDEKGTSAAESVRRLDSIPIIEEEGTDSQPEAADMKNSVVIVSTAKTLEAAFNMEAWSSDEPTAVDNMAEGGNVLLEDNGSVMSVTPAELQNGDARLNFDLQNQNIDSSSVMLSCRGEEAHTAGSHSEKGYSNMEDSNSLLGISMPESLPELVNLTITSQWNEPSVGFQEARPPNFPSALEPALDVVDETIDFSQKLRGGTEANMKESENQSEGCDDTRTESALDAETIDFSQKLQDGKEANMKESENQSEGCDDTGTESASTSERAMYYLSFPEKEVFSSSDLVWGKVKSHPWWPGQIFDLSGASQLAIKYQKKDHFLVAYFGDKTFAWCEEARLKPFQSCFSQMEKQTSSDSFLRALRDILAEISRRVELSMACSCLPEETYADVKYQKVENAGVRGKIVDSVFDRCEIVNYFHTDHLLEYVKSLGLLPTGGADRLELTVAQAQLKAFYLSKGYTELPAFTIGSGLVENDFETPSSASKKLNEDDLEHSATLSNLFSTKGKLRSRDGSLGKQKEIVEDGRKQKSLSELMEDDTNFLLVNMDENASEVQEDENCWSSGNKRKALDYVSSDFGRSKAKKVDFQEDEETKLPSPTSNSSFKVGAFISRAASKLTSGQPIRKCAGETSERCLPKTDDWDVDYMDIDDFLDVNFDYPKLQIDISVDYPPTKEMLSKLCLAARNPLKGYNFSSIVINFFCTFRNVQVSNISIEKHKAEKPRAKRGRKKKIISDLESPDMSTPDHMKDSYWSDMVIPEKDAPLNTPKRRGRKKRKFIDESPPSQMLNSPPDCDPKLHAGTMCPHVKTAERLIIIVEEKIVDERTPTAVILYFNGSNSLPSDTDLIRIFSRYGPLKEEETYVERKNNSAMVVFKKRTDAEMAFSSAGKFSTFGPALLSYRLRHFPFESSPVNTLIGEDDAMPTTKDGHLGISAEPEFNGALDQKLCEDLDKESSTFVQSQEHFRSASDIPPGEFSELAPYEDGAIVASDSAPANTATKEPSQDVPAQMETGAGSDHLLLESLDPEFSYFDLDQAVVAGDISGADLEVENSSGLLLDGAPQVSHAANDRSSGEESCDPAPIGAETSSSVTVDAQLMEEQREVTAASDSTQVELAVSACISEQEII